MKVTKLEILEALMGMVDQFFYTDKDSGEIQHQFMSVQETAIEILMLEGLAEEIEVGMNGYKLNWDKLEKRKKVFKIRYMIFEKLKSLFKPPV